MRRHSASINCVLITALLMFLIALPLSGAAIAASPPKPTLDALGHGMHVDFGPPTLQSKPVSLQGIQGNDHASAVGPRITACDPAFGPQGAFGAVMIQGVGTHFVQAQSHVTFSGQGVTVQDTAVQDPTHILALVLISKTAPIGPRSVNVVTGAETPVALASGFTVTYLTYYFAEGTCRPGFDPYLCIQNQDVAAAQVTITYMKGDGSTAKKAILIPAHSRATINPKEQLGTADDVAHDFSTLVQCTNSQTIIAERPMYFNYMGYTSLNWNGGHDVVGTLTPSTGLGFAEGTCRPGFDTYFCIQNPSGTKANVVIQYMLGDGKTVNDAHVVAAHSRATVKSKDKLGEGNDSAHDFSAVVGTTNGVGIIVERPMYFDYLGGSNHNWTGGSDVMGSPYAADQFCFAEGTCRPGFDPYLCIQNTSSSQAAAVTVDYVKGDGDVVEDNVTIAPHSRVTLNPKDKLGTGNDPAHDFSTLVRSTGKIPVLAERPMYFDYNGYTQLHWNGGHDVIGSSDPLLQYSFAEGTCRPGFDTYLCIYNADEIDANIHITYMTGDGKNVQQDLPVPSGTRATVRVKDQLGEGDDSAHDFSTVVESKEQVVFFVERPMYFNYSGGYNHGWTGGSDVMGQ